MPVGSAPARWAPAGRDAPRSAAHSRPATTRAVGTEEDMIRVVSQVTLGRPSAVPEFFLAVRPVQPAGGSAQGVLLALFVTRAPPLHRGPARPRAAQLTGAL